MFLKAHLHGVPMSTYVSKSQHGGKVPALEPQSIKVLDARLGYCVGVHIEVQGLGINCDICLHSIP